MLETYAHVTPKMRSSAVSKVRVFFGSGDAIAPPPGVATPHVDTGAEVECDPPVTPGRSEEASQVDGKR